MLICFDFTIDVFSYGCKFRNTIKKRRSENLWLPGTVLTLASL